MDSYVVLCTFHFGFGLVAAESILVTAVVAPKEQSYEYSSRKAKKVGGAGLEPATPCV